ncbi:hypothetical protein HHI36_002369 [Cryptolaemus montrouzieri]|uniref:Uncharacterized protein n=1 Tax=Cryptolaemus montrouzieri TaxID=559131 RepID=A0ABD2PAV0_9CUCU
MEPVTLGSPPLFENVEINNGNEEKIDDDTFFSVRQDSSTPFDQTPQTNSRAPEDISRLCLNEEKTLETIPINADAVESSMQEKVEAESGDQFIEITITESQKIGDGMGAYMAYKVTTKTNMQIFKTESFLYCADSAIS